MAPSNPYLYRDGGLWTINPPNMRSIGLTMDPREASESTLRLLNAWEQWQASKTAASTSTGSDSNSEPTDSGMLADVNNDGVVNTADVQALQADIEAGEGVDINDDGVVNLGDVQALWARIQDDGSGESTPAEPTDPAPGPDPEPTESPPATGSEASSGTSEQAPAGGGNSGTSDPVSTRMDVNEDGSIDTGDVQALQQRLEGGTATSAFDYNDDGEVNIGDVQYLFSHVDGVGSPASAAPEQAESGSESFGGVDAKLAVGGVAALGLAAWRWSQR